MAKKKIEGIIINKDWCKGCGICIHFCPTKVLAMSKGNKSEVVNLAACTGCKMCELRCPDLAISVKIAEDKE